ncbi:MAG: hypothetical protein GWP75_01295 [Planctomycetia bacterium]|jgi:hypothetical protein|nr:hypothetical protein [Planctomycetia bacterium]
MRPGDSNPIEPERRSISRHRSGGAFLASLVLSLVTTAMLTLLIVVRLEGEGASSDLRAAGGSLWWCGEELRPGSQWACLADYGMPLVETPSADAPSLPPPPDWMPWPEDAAGLRRIAGFSVGWPVPWVGMTWRRVEGGSGWPPFPYDDENGSQIEAAAKRLRGLDPTGRLFLDDSGLFVNILFWTFVWFLVIMVVRWWFGPPSDDRGAKSNVVDRLPS